MEDSDNLESIQKQIGRKERMILEYVSSEPGCNKTNVVKHFENKIGLSRNPVFRIIKSLIENEFIIEEKDHHNKNTRKLFINQSNHILSINYEMERLQELFSTMLARLTEKYPMIYDEEDKVCILQELVFIFRDFVDTYMIHAMLGFELAIQDKQTLYGMQKIILENVTTIITRYSKFFNPQHGEKIYLPFRDKDVRKRFREKIDKNSPEEADFILLKFQRPEAQKIIQIFSKYGLENEMRQLMECLNNVHSKYHHYQL